MQSIVVSEASISAELIQWRSTDGGVGGLRRDAIVAWRYDELMDFDRPVGEFLRLTGNRIQVDFVYRPTTFSIAILRHIMKELVGP